MKRLLTRTNLQLAGWVAVIVIMLLGGYYRLYLVPWQAYNLSAALAVLIALLLLGALGHKHHQHSCEAAEHQQPSWLETAAHFLPLFLFLAMGETSLGQQAARVEDPFATSGRTAQAKPIEAEKTEDGHYKVNLYQIYSLRQFYEESVPVEVVGMLYLLQPEDEKNLPRGVDPEDVRTLLFRYVIVCCVADATQATVVLKGKDPSAFEAGTWLKVKGKTKPPEGALTLMIIEVDTIEKISQPANPYIY